MTLDTARDFLARVLPWEAGQAYFNIHWRSLGTDGRLFWGGRAATSLDGLVKSLSWATKQADIKDLYVCMSSQSSAEERVSKAGFKYLNAVRSQEHVVALKSLYLDIDVKDGGYADTRTAVLALKQFILDTGLPNPSAIVASGSGGMHVHWVLDRALPKAEWQVLANALARATRDLGLSCDPQCTIDSARILRIPGTFNAKTDPPKPVKTMMLGDPVPLDAVQAALGRYITHEPPAPLTRGVNDELGEGLGGEAKPVDLDAVAKNCGFVREALESRGATYTNPLWFLTTALATFSEGGREDAHRMASGHPGYEPAKTDELFDRLMKARLEKDVGWPKCEKIELSGCSACASCPLKAAKKSPLNYGFKAANDTPIADALPDGFFRNPEGHVFRRAVGDDGTPIALKIFDYPMTDAWLQDNPWVLHFSTVVAHEKRKVDLPLEIITSRDGLPKFLFQHGMVVREKADKLVREFFVAWIQKLQQTKDAVVSSTPFGWATRPNGSIEGFTYAGRVWSKDGDRPAANPDGVIASQYAPRGELSKWLELSKVVADQERPALDAILAAAFGGPIVRFTGQPGLLMSAYSAASGIGKTTTMRIAQAVWGDPYKALQSLSDTQLSVLNKIGQLRELPMFWDEIKTESETNKFVQLVFQITQGKEKSRMRADVTQREVGVWKTLMVSASNESLIDPMERLTSGTTAGTYRLFQFEVTRGVKGQLEGAQVDRMLAKLSDNFGNAGLVYAQFLGSNHERIEQEVAELHDDLQRRYDHKSDERFWFATMTSVLSGARYANECGLTTIDLAALETFLAETLEGMRSHIRSATTDMSNTMSVSNILAQFLNAMRTRHTLVTNRIHVGQGKPAAGAIQAKGDTSKLDGIYVQIGQDDGLMRISSTYLSRWMGDHGYSRHAFTKALKDDFGMKVVNGKLGSGTSFASPMEYLLELDMNDPNLKGFVE